jgi:hypothetical protein
MDKNRTVKTLNFIFIAELLIYFCCKLFYRENKILIQ